MEELTFTFVGSGNVAGVLARSLVSNGFKINTVISRNKATANALAYSTGAIASDTYVIPIDTDIVIIAVSDDAIAEVISKLTLRGEPIVVHTSGSTDLTVFPSLIPRNGVIYPLQTFTSGRDPEMGKIHVFTEASDEETHLLIDRVAASITPNIHRINSYDRGILHLTAVFVSNFVNHMLTSGFEIAEGSGIDPVVFEPLIKETIDKGLKLGPAKAQTGPAVRNDIRIIKKHIELLSFSDELKNLYIMITDSIIKHTKKK